MIDKVISVSILDNSKVDPKTINKDKIKNGIDKFILSVSENDKRSSFRLQV